MGEFDPKAAGRRAVDKHGNALRRLSCDDRRRTPTVDVIKRRREAWHQQRASKVEEMDYVPVGPFRERFVYLRDRGEMTTQALCWHMGWVSPISEETARKERRRPGTLRPRTSHAVRVLGLRDRRVRQHDGCVQQHVTYDTAEKLCRALGMDPWEAGI